MCCAVLELALRAPPHMALAAGLGIAGIVSPDPREKKKVELGLFLAKEFFLMYFLQKHDRNKQIPTLCPVTQERLFSLTGGEKKYQNHE